MEPDRVILCRSSRSHTKHLLLLFFFHFSWAFKHACFNLVKPFDETLLLKEHFFHLISAFFCQFISQISKYFTVLHDFFFYRLEVFLLVSDVFLSHKLTPDVYFHVILKANRHTMFQEVNPFMLCRNACFNSSLVLCFSSRELEVANIETPGQFARLAVRRPEECRSRGWRADTPQRKGFKWGESGNRKVVDWKGLGPFPKKVDLFHPISWWFNKVLVLIPQG